ncbi:CoA-acylating methylmalonate-semialdehyde dehydrogenase [Radiobacillus kanasensis]|uniref:CoA-acylating methylmalonate-semialdehyde dehydrogenase n=1 Tax=Radiobacillus kanasensis TaxID=2844358 RepID=UPI001E481BE4|nr:CoA-acylating methylmalonate-semialdehyde dehydrogenase [Radiobacillus kanasensis]UFT99090.1 CoA-acylating methylmalonate-semialdehyde dehydrogenase [Radiobacillus kanasensis]
MSDTKQETVVLQNYVHAKWVDANTDQYQEVPNPATGETIARVPISSFSDVDHAVEIAKEAFKFWSKTPVPKRARVLFRYQQLLLDHHEELAELVTRENGKSYKEAYGEVQRGIECVEFAAGAPTLMMGDNLSTIATDIDSQMFRYPLGVVGGISPFNFPMMVPCWMFPLAIACGNTFILKPSERTPLLANRLAELFTEAGLPAGVFNIVHGAHDVVNGLLTHEHIKAISFVGSEPVAKYVYQEAAANGKRVQALAGAKNHHIVMPDAIEEVAIQNIISSSFGSAGQRCMACSAVVVVGDGDDFVEKLVDEVNQIKMGNGFDEGVLLTPVIREENCSNALRYIELGLKEGAKLIRDGRKDKEDHPDGYFLGATIFDQVQPHMAIAKDEIFAPVLSILRADSLEEALDIVNQSKFGNSATLYSQDAKAVRTFREEAEPGMLGVNVGVPAPMAFFPFSGAKSSFFGDLHANGKDGVEFYTRKKMITSRF